MRKEGFFPTGTCFALCFFLLFPVMVSAGEKDTSGAWEELQLPPYKTPFISDFGIEEGGIPWIMANHSLYYLDGKEFRKPEGAEIKSGQYITRLVGGLERGLYATCSSREKYHGSLFRLSDGRVKYIADFYREDMSRAPLVYVSRSGRIFNWGNRFLAVLKNGEWKKEEASLSYRDVCVIDTGDTVYFYYNGNLFSVDGEYRFSSRKLDPPFQYREGSDRIFCGLWGKDRILLIREGENKVYSWNLESGNPISTDEINRKIGRVYDFFAAPDGSVWLYVRVSGKREIAFVRITPGGDVEEIKEIRNLHWQSERAFMYPHSILGASDGSLWFGTSSDGVSRFSNGRLELFGWKNGIKGDITHIFEDEEGGIYAISPYGGIYVYRQEGVSSPPEWVENWREYPIASSWPIRDFLGNIWMFRKDRPGEISTWNGKQWNHRKVPFDTSRVGRLFSDDRGHVLLSMMAYPDGCFEIGPREIHRHENMKTMLEHAVRNGATRFITNSHFAGCMVKGDGGIWYGIHGNDNLYYYEGGRWTSHRFENYGIYILESPEYGFLIGTRQGKYYTVDRGQIIEISLPETPPTRWLLGEKSFQPWEEDLITKYPGKYIPLEKDCNQRYYLLARRKMAGKGGNPSRERGDPLPANIQTVTPAFSKGFWSDGTGGDIYRFLGGSVVKCDFSDTPLEKREKDIRQLLEDREGNLWIYTKQRNLYSYRGGGIVLKTSTPPEKAKRFLKLDARVLENNHPVPGSRIFWRFQGEDWNGAKKPGKICISFPEDGKYQVEITAIGPLGESVSDPVTFSIQASVPFPDTRLTGDPPFESRDISWMIPARPVPSEPKVIPELYYRINGREWRKAYMNDRILFEGETSGTCRIRVAAREMDVFSDPTPLEFDVEYNPDYERMVESRLEALAGEDIEERERAVRELQMAGSRVDPVIRKKIREINHMQRMIQPLHRSLHDVSVYSTAFPHLEMRSNIPPE